MMDTKTTAALQRERKTQTISQAFEDYATAWTDFGVYKYGAKVHPDLKIRKDTVDSLMNTYIKLKDTSSQGMELESFLVSF